MRGRRPGLIGLIYVGVGVAIAASRLGIDLHIKK